MFRGLTESPILKILNPLKTNANMAEMVRIGSIPYNLKR
jgi:hypothetical protein